MRPLSHLLPVVGLASLLSACGSLSKLDLTRLVTDGRDGWQRPEAVIAALQIQPGDAVAEIGAGTGYWIGRLSEAVGPTGTVFAVEVDDDLVERLREKAEQDGLTNVEVVRGEYADPRLPDGAVDLAITSQTYHHIEDRVHYFERLKQDLSARGRVAHLDDRDDLPRPLRWLPSEGHWTNAEAMQQEMRHAGYVRTEAFDFLLMQSFQVFEPTVAEAANR
jgi:ubiquinone/menaquinone biosynthesis C-methylase UbiE